MFDLLSNSRLILLSRAFHSQHQISTIIVDREMSRHEDHQRYCDERMAQQIRDNNQTLRALESKIRAIYVRKGLGVQLAEQEQQQLQQKIDMETERQEMRQLEAARQQHERKMALETRKRQAKQRNDLQEQMADKQAKRRLLYEEFLKEKIIIDEIMAQIQQEQIEYGKMAQCLSLRPMVGSAITH